MQNFGWKYIIIIVAGIALIVSGVLSSFNTANLLETGSETTAVVTERTQGGRNARARVFVEYTVDGVLYRNRLNIQFARTYLEQEVAILYNPDNPNEITPRDRGWATDDSLFGLGSRFGSGVMLILLSVYLGWRNFKRTRQGNAAHS